MTHTLPIRVRYPECDPMGYLHHSNYLRYFEMGRIELIRSLGISYVELERRGILFVVAKAQISYKAPAHFDDELTLFTKLARQTMVRIDHTYELKRGQTLLAEGATTIACVDREGQVQAIPEFLVRSEPVGQ